MKNLLMLTLLICTSTYVWGQNDNNIALSALPYYNYGKGLGITSPDSIFQFNIRFRMQNRVSYYNDDQKDGSVEALIRRLRLRFDGFIVDPKIVYVIQLSFTPGDVGVIREGDNLNIIRDAIVFYRPNRHWNIGFGQTKLPGNRQRVNSSGALQLTDRSINNARFNLDRDFGLQVYYLNEEKDAFSYNIKTAISTGEGRNWTKNPDDGLAYTGKIELFPLGVFHGDGSLFEGDIKREQEVKLMLSGGYHYNHKARRSQGTLGNELFASRTMSSTFLDGMLKYQGWSFQTAYMTRMAQDPITENPEVLGDLEYVYTGHGYDAQLSYMFLNYYELIGRYSYQTPHHDLALLVPSTHQFSIGVTKYIWEHTLKLQAEVTNTQLDHVNTSNRSNWYARFQVEIGI